jgi:hypothetical protein
MFGAGMAMKLKSLSVEYLAQGVVGLRYVAGVNSKPSPICCIVSNGATGNCV